MAKTHDQEVVRRHAKAEMAAGTRRLTGPAMSSASSATAQLRVRFSQMRPP
jgi:hypothetical protein